MFPSPESRRSRGLLALLVVLHVAYVSRQVDAGGGRSLLQRGLFALLYPLELGVARSVSGVRGLWLAYVGLRGVRAENAELAQRLAALELEVQGLRAAAEESGRLRALLELRAAHPGAGLAARVVGRGALPWFRTLVIDRGSRQGVALDSPVIAPQGLVGRVIEVTDEAAKVQVLTDQRSGVAVLFERSRLPGVVSGQVGPAGAARLELRVEYVAARAEVQAGDRLVTSGLDHIYPPGVVVGRVLRAAPGTGLFQEVVAEPVVDLVRLEAVLVLPPQPEPPLGAEEAR